MLQILLKVCFNVRFADVKLFASDTYMFAQNIHHSLDLLSMGFCLVLLCFILSVCLLSSSETLMCGQHSCCHKKLWTMLRV